MTIALFYGEDSFMTFHLLAFVSLLFVYYCHGDETERQASGERFSEPVHVRQAHNRASSFIIVSYDVL